MTAFSDASPAAVLGRHGGGVLGASLGASASAAVVTVQGDGVIVYDCDTQVRPRDRSRDLSAARDRPTTREPPARRAAPATPRAANSPPPPPSPPHQPPPLTAHIPNPRPPPRPPLIPRRPAREAGRSVAVIPSRPPRRTTPFAGDTSPRSPLPARATPRSCPGPMPIPWRPWTAP